MLGLDNVSSSVETMINTISQLTNTLKVLLGGVFGVYVILLIVTWWERRKLVSLMKDIKNEIHKLNKQFETKKKK